MAYKPSSTKNAGEARDPETHQLRRGSRRHQPMMVHIGVDEISGLTHHVKCTATNVGDVTVIEAMLHGKDGCVLGDRGNTGADKRVAWPTAKRRSSTRLRDPGRRQSGARERKQAQLREACKSQLARQD
nr:transposase [Stenotrophomonas pavanii]